MLQDAVKENGLKPLSTSTNFMYVDLGSLNAEEFRKEMENEVITILGKLCIFQKIMLKYQMNAILKYILKYTLDFYGTSLYQIKVFRK
jgi:hypothetical protein